MWPDRRLCDLLKIDHPILLSPMARSGTIALASAVSNAGALGAMGCGEMTISDLHVTVAGMQAATNRPFNLNFWIDPAPRTEPAVLARTREQLQPWYDAAGLGGVPRDLPDLASSFGPDHLALLLDARPPVVSFHFGVPDPAAIAALKAAGITLISTATTVAEARVLETAGMDAIIAQGWEAGGHHGTHSPRAPTDGIGSLALIPQIADAVAVPVIAAGGIGDGRGIAAAFALGASGVQIGTAFLSCAEAGTDPARRALLRTATDTDTIVTTALSGRAARARRSDFATAMAQSREPVVAFRHMYTLTDPLLDAGIDAATFHLFGQSAALNRDQPAADLLARLIAETAIVIDKLATGNPATSVP